MATDSPNPDDPNDKNNPDGQGGTTGSTGCGPGKVFTELDSNGKWVGNVGGTQGECVDAAEAERRRNITTYPTGFEPGGGAGGGYGAGPKAPSGPAQYKFTPVPQFTPPEFKFDEVFQAPTLEQAQNEPGYAFARDQGLGALQSSQAAQGLLRTGGSLKDLIGWGNKFAEQNYGNVFDRYARGYDTRLKTAEDKYGFQYTGAKDAYAPNLFEWQTKNAFGANAALANWNRMWDDYWRSTLSASDIYNAGNQ